MMLFSGLLNASGARHRNWCALLIVKRISNLKFGARTLVTPRHPGVLI
jgi:hypothetical protein